jgi:hypothetical protein
LSAAIPTRGADGPRRSSAIMSDVNRAFEQAVRRDPANWFWVHNRWKFGKRNHPPWPARACAATTGGLNLEGGG